MKRAIGSFAGIILLCALLVPLLPAEKRSGALVTVGLIVAVVLAVTFAVVLLRKKP